MKLNIFLLVSYLVFCSLSCDKKDEVTETGLLENLLRVEALVSIDQCDFTRSNSQVSNNIKEILYFTFDTRDGSIMINNSNDELSVAIDYTSLLGTKHTGEIISRIYKNGDRHFVDFEGNKMEDSGSIMTSYAFAIDGVEETKDEVIDDVTKTRELSFELTGMDVCTFLNASTNSTYIDNPYFVWDSGIVKDELIQCDCMAGSRLLVKYVYHAN